jgi:hypothetical protein
VQLPRVYANSHGSILFDCGLTTAIVD